MDIEKEISRHKKPKLRKQELTCTIFSKEYWREARAEFNVKTLVFAALIIALRVAIKGLKINLGVGLSLSFDCYVNSLGSIVYGPLVALAVGAISDPIGFIAFPSGTYFLPFMLVEMSSSFLFALFFWRRKIRVSRVLIAKLTVNLFCNIILTSLFMKWMYVLLYPGQSYYIVNVSRIVKNLILFPLESILIVVVLRAFLPALKRFHAVPESQSDLVIKKKHIIGVAAATLFSIWLVLFYIFYLRDVLVELNIKFW